VPPRRSSDTQMPAPLAALPPLHRYDAAFLAGDFNCPPESAPIRWLLTESGYRITDARAAGTDFITRETSARRPAQRIDHIFLLETRPDPAVTVARIERVFDRRDAALGILPSDHYGVMGWFEIGDC